MNIRSIFWVPLLIILSILPNLNADEMKTESEFATAPPSIIINEIDGTKLILIPGGEFIAGGENKNEGSGEFVVALQSFYIAETTVNNAQYKKFVDETGYRSPDQAECMGKMENLNGTWYHPDQSDHPVVCVSWHDAKAYCDWAGLRLPSELEWEKAARGIDGRKFPWGNDWDPSIIRNRSTLGTEKTSGVWEYTESKSPYGIMNMSGNVWEWCSDWYGDIYASNYKIGNLTPPLFGFMRTLRGGSWSESNEIYFRCTMRYFGHPDHSCDTIGFRCARDIYEHNETSSSLENGFQYPLPHSIREEAEKYFSVGLNYNFSQEYKFAIEYYNKAISIYPNDPTAYYFRGNAFLKSGDYDNAVIDYSSMINIDPTALDGYLSRGYAYYKTGEYDLAVEDFTNAIKFHPNVALSYSERARIYYEKKSFDLAWEDIQKAYDLDSNSSDIRDLFEKIKNSI